MQRQTARTRLPAQVLQEDPMLGGPWVTLKQSYDSSSLSAYRSQGIYGPAWEF